MSLQTKPDGAGATRQIRERLPKTEVLIFSIHDEDVVITELLKGRSSRLRTKIGFQIRSNPCSRVPGGAQAFLHRQSL